MDIKYTRKQYERAKDLDLTNFEGYILYFTPEYFEMDKQNDIANMSSVELLALFLDGLDFVKIYDIYDFVSAFNNGEISTDGYIRSVLYVEPDSVE